MSCRKAYTRDALANMFSLNFVAKDYKNHRENILFEREKCLLPATQLELEREIRVASFTRKLSQLRRQMENQKSLAKNDDILKAIRKEIKDLTEERRVLNGNTKQKKGVEEPKVVVVKKCPQGECRGFLNKDWECGLCNTHVCKDCHAITGDGHECKPEDVETAKLLAKETKDCPACGTSIFKISGCDQMWCTQCHTAFSWNTLKIEKGVIHNPHFYEFQRQANGGVAPRVPGDVQGGCGELPPHYICVSGWAKMDYKQAELSILSEMHRSINHIQYVMLPRNVIADNGDLRKQYLTHIIDEATFKCKLQRREKMRLLQQETQQVLEMFATCATDLVVKSLSDNAMGEIEELMAYFNDTMKKTASVFKCQTFQMVAGSLKYCMPK
jgi:hypothetical protein